MPSQRKEMESWSSEQVFDSMSNAEPGTIAYTRAAAEILRQQTVFQQEAAAAQERAADAA